MTSLNSISRCLLMTTLGMLILSGSASAASDVHSLGYSSVDNEEIRWGTHWGTTKYSSYRDTAISTWNALDPINIAGDTIFVEEDLSFTDTTRNDVTWPGIYIPLNNDADVIQLNTYYMDQYSTSWKQNVLSHELGHALGIGDHEITYPIMMYYVASGQTTLASHDISDYHSIWGY